VSGVHVNESASRKASSADQLPKQNSSSFDSSQQQEPSSYYAGDILQICGQVRLSSATIQYFLTSKGPREFVHSRVPLFEVDWEVKFG
jgi:hypothetical protein